MKGAPPKFQTWKLSGHPGLVGHRNSLEELEVWWLWKTCGEQREPPFAAIGAQCLWVLMPHALTDWSLSSSAMCWVLHANPTFLVLFLFFCCYHWHNCRNTESTRFKKQHWLLIWLLHISQRVYVHGLPIPPFSIPPWNAKPDKCLLVLFSFCMQYVHDDGALLVFYYDDAKWTKKYLLISTIIISRLAINLGLVESTSFGQFPQFQQNDSFPIFFFMFIYIL